MKAPSWFKLKVERRDVLQSVPPSVAINALMACFDYLDTGVAPDMGALERIVFAAILPDLKEAAGQYEKRVTARTKGNEQHHMTSYDVIRPHMTSYETEQEEEQEEETEVDISPSDEGRDKRARAREPRPRFLPPTVEEVAEYVKQRGSRVDPQGFVDFYTAKGWMVGKTPMKDWKAACRNAENWERWSQKAPKGFQPGKQPSPETDERAKASMERLRQRMKQEGTP